MRISKEPYKVIASCLNLYTSHRNSTPPPDDETMVLAIQRGLNHFFVGLATIHEGLYPGWEADEKHPGYLVRADYPATVRAPYHLVAAFPTEESLNGIWHLSRKIRTIEDSLLCLSGSAATLKSSVIIGDFDFCEYVRISSTEIAASLLSKKTHTDSVLLTQMQLGKSAWKKHFPEEEIQDAVTKLDPSDLEMAHGKIDFLGKADNFRPGEISNVLIFCTDNMFSAAQSKTFALQESHFDATVSVPSELDNPYEMGRYVYWLRNEIRKYSLSKNYPKALKRSLSLARVCFLNEIADEISNYIGRSAEFLERELQEISSIEIMLIETADEFHDWLDELNEARIETEFRLDRLRQSGKQKRLPIAEFVVEVLDQLSQALEGRERAT